MIPEARADGGLGWGTVSGGRFARAPKQPWRLTCGCSARKPLLCKNFARFFLSLMRNACSRQASVDGRSRSRQSGCSSPVGSGVWPLQGHVPARNENGPFAFAAFLLKVQCGQKCVADVDCAVGTSFVFAR